MMNTPAQNENTFAALNGMLDRLEAENRALRQHKTDYMEAAEETRRALQTELEAIRSRRVVIPDRIQANAGKEEWYRYGWNACLDELARLNGKTVSESLLRRLCEIEIPEFADDICNYQRCPCCGGTGEQHHGTFYEIDHADDCALQELRILLDAGKEDGNG